MAVALVALALASASCATSRLIDRARGHDSSGPPRDFRFVLEAAFFDETDGIVLYGTHRSRLGETAWFGAIPRDSRIEGAAESSRAARLAVPWSGWIRAREPYRLIVIPSTGGADAEPSADDIDACTVRGQLRRQYRELRIVGPGEVAPTGTPSLAMRGEAVAPQGFSARGAPVQIVLRNVSDSLPESGTDDVEVVFLEDPTSPAPYALLELPLVLSLDVYLFAIVAGIGPPYLAIREGVDRIRGLWHGGWSYRYARGLEQGKQYGCRCVASRIVVEGGSPVAGCWGYDPVTPAAPASSTSPP